MVLSKISAKIGILIINSQYYKSLKHTTIALNILYNISGASISHITYHMREKTQKNYINVLLVFFIYIS
jgi:hypothetical protein